MNNFSIGKCTFWVERYIAITLIFLCVSFAACSSRQADKLSSSQIGALVTEQTKNPLPDLMAAATAGKSFYAVHCTICHGDDGKGEGTAGGSLAKKPTDLTTSEIVSEPDGKLFLAVKNGVKKEGKQIMPPAKNIPDEQVWQIIAYVRSLTQK